MTVDASSVDLVQPTADWTIGRVRLAAGWVAAFMALSALVGAFCAVFWVQVVDLPSYTVRDDYSARTTERGLAEYFGSDAWFALIGIIVAVALGLIAWKWFSELGWPVAVIAAAGALLAGLVCWWVGERLGPGPFDVRLGSANPGDVVPVQFLLRSKVALAVWVLGAVAPVLIWSALGPDSDDPPKVPTPPRRNRWSPLPRSPQTAAPAESGEVVGHDIDPLPR